MAIDTSSSKQKLHSSIELELNELNNENSHRLTFYLYSLIEDTIILEQRITYTMKIPAPISNDRLRIVHDKLTTDSSENSPDSENNNELTSVNNAKIPQNNDTTTNSSMILNILGRGGTMLTSNVPTNIELEYLDDNFIRKTHKTSYSINCEAEFEFMARFYTMDKRSLINIYRGEQFLLRVNIRLKTNNDTELDILETYFICVS